MSIIKVELELYTAMNEYNKYGDDFNKVIINHIYTAVAEKTKIFEYTLNKINLDEIGTLLLKCSEVSTNCNLLLNDSNNTNKINNLKRSIEELDIIETNVRESLVEIMKKLDPDGIIQSIIGKYN